MKTPLLIEQHFHGGYGVNFNTASVDDVIYLSKEILKEGIGTIFPTLVTDSVENIKQQIQIIKTAASKQTEDMTNGTDYNMIQKEMCMSQHQGQTLPMRKLNFHTVLVM